MTRIVTGITTTGQVLVAIEGIPRPWWAFWRSRSAWAQLDAGPARTLAIGIRQAADKITRAQAKA